MAATPGTVEHRTVHLSSGAALTIVLTAVGLMVAERVFVAAHRPLSWAAAAVVAAILLDPVVDRLAVRIRRVPAVLLTFFAIGAVGVGTAYFVFDGLQEAVDRLESAAPEAAVQIQERDDRLGELAGDFRLTERVDSFVEALSDRVTGGDDVLRSTAGTAPTYLVSAILTVFLMTYGPRIARAAIEQDPDEARRERVAGVVGPAVSKARSAVVLSVGTALAVGVVSATVASVLDLPAALAVGFTAGLLALLPHVGIVIGSVPLLLLSLGFRSALVAVLVGAVAVALQVLDSMVVRRWIARRSVDVGLFVPWVVVLVGYEVYGVGGAAYGLAFAIGGLAVLDQLHGRGALAAVEVVEAVVSGVVTPEPEPRTRTRSAKAAKTKRAKATATKKAATKTATAPRKAATKEAATKKAAAKKAAAKQRGA
jgi:predicted PurR-regulated permease PerM